MILLLDQVWHVNSEHLQSSARETDCIQWDNSAAWSVLVQAQWCVQRDGVFPPMTWGSRGWCCLLVRTQGKSLSGRYTPWRSLPARLPALQKRVHSWDMTPYTHVVNDEILQNNWRTFSVPMFEVPNSCPPYISENPELSCSWPSLMEEKSMWDFPGYQYKLHFTMLCIFNLTVFLSSVLKPTLKS